MFTNAYTLSPITQIETGETLSSPAFKKAIDDRRDFLSKNFNIKKGISVLLLNNNTINFFIDLFAILNLGATAVPLDANTSDFEIEKVKAHARISLTITEKGDFPEKYQQSGLIDKAFVIYTSGTSGDPKGIVISYDAFRKKIAVNLRRFSGEELKRPLCILPTFFGMGLFSNCIFALLNGEATEMFYIAKKCDLLLASRFVSILKENKISFFNSVLSNWDLILNFALSPLAGDLSNLKRVQFGSNFFNAEKVRAIQNWLGDKVSLYDVYGLTEMGGSVCVSKVEKEHAGNYFTDFWSLEYKIGPENELLLKSDYMFDGYFENPSATKESFTSDGFFRTGDSFINHSLNGRLKNLIVKHDTKIYPQEIDAFLINSGLVTDSYSFPINDSFSGERLGTLICLAFGVKESCVREYCSKNLSSSKIPDKIFILDKIERNARGKISSEKLNKIIEG